MQYNYGSAKVNLYIETNFEDKTLPAKRILLKLHLIDL